MKFFSHLAKPGTSAAADNVKPLRNEAASSSAASTKPVKAEVKEESVEEKKEVPEKVLISSIYNLNICVFVYPFKKFLQYFVCRNLKRVFFLCKVIKN